MTTNEVQQKLAGILSGNATMTSQQATALRKEAGTRRLELATRLDEIKTRDRIRVLQTGTPEQVEALKVEEKALQVEHDQLTAQIDELTARREAALTREAVEGLPAMHSTLADQVARAEQLGIELANALREINGTVQAIMAAKRRADRAAIPVGGASPAMCKRILSISRWCPPDLLVNGRHVDHWADGIGPTEATGKHLEKAA